MPSPSPTSRKSPSPLAPRNLTGSFGPDLLTISNSPAASRALHEKFDEYKENTGNGKSRGAVASNENLRSPSKKPWVRHFGKATTTLPPSNRILVERNSSCSPVRSGRENTEALYDKRLKTPPREREDVSISPGPVKDIVELSKRIQHFLDSQDLLHGTSHEVMSASASASVAPVEQEQKILSSPYNPYNSPFSERPKFLRLHSNSSSIDAAQTFKEQTTQELPLFERDKIQTLKEQTTEELPLFEGDKVLVTPFQQIQFSADLSPVSTEAEDVEQEEEIREQVIPEAVSKEEEAFEKTLKGNDLPIHYEKCRSFQNSEKIFKNEGIPCLVSTSEADMADDYKDKGSVKDDTQTGTVTGHMTSMLVKEDPLEKYQVHSISDDEGHQSAREAEEANEVNFTDRDVPWGNKIPTVMFCWVLIAAFLALMLLSSGSPGLLPQSLCNNTVHSLWQANKYQTPTLLLLNGMNGLWSTDMMHYPVAIGSATLTGESLLLFINKLSNQAKRELQLFVQLASSSLDDWWMLVNQYLSPHRSPDVEGEHENRGNQFMWIPEYDFEGEWLDEEPKLAYTDWELLYEYDMWAANQFVLGSVPDILKCGLQKNFSRLSDSPEVKGLLEELMMLKGGESEEDRLEVLQYFWEYMRFSASTHESLLTSFQFEPTEVEKQLSTNSLSDESLAEIEEQLSTAAHINLIDELDPRQDQPESEAESISGAENDKVRTEKDLNGLVTAMTPINAENILELKCHGSPIEWSVSQNVKTDAMTGQRYTVDTEKDLDKVVSKVTKISPRNPLELLPQAFPVEWSGSQAETDAVEWSGSQADTVGREDKPAIEFLHPTSDVKFDLSQLATLGTFLVASLFIVCPLRRSKGAAKAMFPVSSVQFLKKTEQTWQSTGDINLLYPVARQDKKQVTMIEELNDSFASVLQSPEPNLIHLMSLQARKDEDLIRRPIAASASSPYGSYTTYKLVSKKEGQAVESKLTPVRRSSRISNHVSMSPSTNGAKRVAISPP